MLEDSKIKIDDEESKKYFFFTDVSISGLIIMFLGVYMGACQLNSLYGLKRIEYEDIIEYISKQKSYKVMRVRMYIGRFVLLTLMICPFISAIVCLVQYKPDLIEMYESIIICLISCLCFFFSHYLVFLLFERLSAKLKHDINQFEIIDRKDDLH